MSPSPPTPELTVTTVIGKLDAMLDILNALKDQPEPLAKVFTEHRNYIQDMRSELDRSNWREKTEKLSEEYEKLSEAYEKLREKHEKAKNQLEATKAIYVK